MGNSTTDFKRIYDGTLASTGKQGESMRAVADALSHRGWSSDSERCYAAGDEIDRLYDALGDAVAILRRCRATCSPARVEEIDAFLSKHDPRG